MSSGSYIEQDSLENEESESPDVEQACDLVSWDIPRDSRLDSSLQLASLASNFDTREYSYNHAW